MEYGEQTQGYTNIDLAARERMASFRFRFGSSPINPSSSTNSNTSSPLTTGTNFSLPSTGLGTSMNATPTRTPMAPAKTHGRTSSHSRSHSRSGSIPTTTFTFPLKPSTMNNVPPSLSNVNATSTITTSRQSPPTFTSNVIGTTYDSSQYPPSPPRPAPAPAPAPRSRPNSHHRRRSSVSTRRESAELMGISLPPESSTSTGVTMDSDTIIDGRRMALWALEGKERATRRPDFIGGYTKVEIPELNETTLSFNSVDENEPPTWSSSKVNGFGSTHNSFPPLTSSTSSKRDSLPAFTFGSGPSSTSVSSGKRDSLPPFGLTSVTTGNKRDSFPSFNSGFGLSMGMSSANKRDSFGKFLTSCSPSDQLGTLIEEEEDVEEDASVDELENFDVEEEDEEEEEADETFRVDTYQVVDDDDDDEYAEDPEEEGDILQVMDLDEEPLPHAHLYPQITLPSKNSAPAPMSTSPPISTPISVSTDISISRVTSPIPVVELIPPLFPSSSSPSSSTPIHTTASRPRPANLNLNLNNFALRPLSLTPDSLPLNTRAASISAFPNFNDSPTSNAGSGSAAYTPSTRVPGLRKLSLVAAASSPTGSVSSTQSSLARRMGHVSSTSPLSSNSSGTTSSVSYKRSPLSVESESGSSVTSSSEIHPSRPNHQYATLRRTSQSHLPTPGATPTSAVPPSLSGLPFGIGTMREDCEEEEHTETRSQVDENEKENNTEDVDGDASTPTGPALTVNTAKSGLQADLDRPLSPTEQAFLFRSHTSLLGRISELEEIISQKTLENRERRRSRGLSPASDISASSSYGRRHGRFESSASSVSTNTSLDTTPATTSPSEPSDELLQLITDLKSERDGLMHDLQTYQSRISDLEKTITTLTRRVEAERRESWVAQERMSVLEIERRRAAEEVSRLENVVKDLHDGVRDFERVKAALVQEKERISILESHVEAVRCELDDEKVKAGQVGNEAGMLRKQIEKMNGEMDALRALVAEQHAQILQFQQMQMQQQKRVMSIKKNYNSSHTSFASTSASDSVSFPNAHSHMSSSSTLAVDVDADAEVDEDFCQYKYVPVGMSPPRSHTRATLGSVAEAEEDTVTTDHHDDVPRDITPDESEEEEDDVDGDELSHYEDAGEYDEDEDEDDQVDDEENEEDVVWGEDTTTSSFGDFVPRGISNTPTPTPSSSTGTNYFPAPSARGHARVGSMQKGWSFAAARANAVQAQSLPMLDLTPNTKSRNLSRGITAESKTAQLPKVDRFFECLDALEDEDDDGTLTVKMEFSDAKSFWNGAVRQQDEDDDEMDLPPFLLPATASSSSTSDSTSPSSLNAIEEDDDEDESSPHLATPVLTPSWKDLIAATLDVVAEEDEEDLQEEDDDCPPSPSLRPTLARNARVSLLPRSVPASASFLIPPTAVLSPMTPNTLKTTLDATVRSPRPAGPNNTNANRWNIVGASLGLGFPSNHSTNTPIKARSSPSPSTPVNGGLLPTPPPTLIPRLSSKSGLSSPTSPSPAPSISPVPSCEYVQQERGFSTPTKMMSKYSAALSPSRIPTPSKRNTPKERSMIGSGFIPVITAAATTVGNTTSSATVKPHHVFHEISYTPYSTSHQGEGPDSGSRAGLDSNNDNEGTLVTHHCSIGNIEGVGTSSRSRLRLDIDTRSLRTRVLPIDLQSSSNSSLSPTFGGFAARLKTFWTRGGTGDTGGSGEDELSSGRTPVGYTSPTRRPVAYVSRMKQVEVLRTRLEKESQGRRMQDEVTRFIGCSHCADPTIIIL